ncbi:MAG: ABC transporter ATP-binding protein [Alphaproteobacteria bacterium]|nr:MAG: ABC transporter ATP-binding protein [Alphaproteobacteria bacterium]
MLRIQDLVYHAGGHALLDHASLAIARGERVGLVGRNGSGKTTLLRLIASALAPDGGTIEVPRSWRVGMLAQDAPSGPDSLIDTVLAADTERTQLLAEAETATDPHHIAEVHERLAAIDAASAPARAARILAGLGFDEAAQNGPCAALSGGWRMRVALAALLFTAPDVLLLDEPTNHLDLEATLWLEGFLRSYPGTLILVSHDRDLLNAVPRRIVHLEAGRLVSYQGNYDRFVRTRAERIQRQAALHARQTAERRRIQAFVDRFRAKATKARQAQSRLKALARMAEVPPPVIEAPPSFAFPPPAALAPPLLALDGVSVGYDGRTILRDLDLRLDMDDRIALLGPNGNGKTTFMRLLAGRLAPLSGEVRRSRKLNVGYFAQDQADELDLTATPLALMARAMPQANETAVRAHLGRFGFGERHAELEIARLSGGEKARLLFALMTRDAPQVLLLDEPTNHLDVETREALVAALNDYPGAVVLVTHDPHVVALTAERLWLVGDGTVQPFDGDLDDYRRLVSERARMTTSPARTDDTAPARPSRRERRRAEAEARAALAPLRRAARKAEARIEALTHEKAALEARLADPEIYQEGGGREVQALQKRLAEVVRALAAAEEEWLEAQSAIEAGPASEGAPGSRTGSGSQTAGRAR